MDTMPPYFKQYQQIKICRLCGTDNKENIDIFTSKTISNRSEDLLTKILTVYPLVLYKDDPFPKHICPKCICNVSTTFQDIQQVLRQQNKWMNLTKAIQPEHQYFRILNVVENSTKATKESIKTSYNIEVNEVPFKKLLAMPSKDNHNNTINTTSKLNVNENVVKNIQTKLESNGFTIKRIKVSASADVNQDINSSNNSLDIADTSLSTPTNTVACNYCQQKFSDLKILAQHQLIHLKLSANKIFQKRLLPKQLRRGRLITINDTKSIRCLNCWRIFNNNKAILQHWSGKECEFYCFICGKEYAHSPVMLREHIPKVHGISYRTAMREFMISKSEPIKPTLILPTQHSISTKTAPGIVRKNYNKKPPRTCTKNDDGTITCKICHKVFTNFRSSNSHMRKHKPTIRYGNTVLTPATRMDIYNTQDDYMQQPSTSHIYHSITNPSSESAINSLHMRPPRPAYRVITKSGPLRGIRTKIVQKRQDFLTNYTHNSGFPVQMSLSSTPETNDDANLIVPELMPMIKTEPMTETETQNNGSSDGFRGTSSAPVIKSEPLDNAKLVDSPRSRLCFICNESFSNSRDYELHTMFVHNIN